MGGPAGGATGGPATIGELLTPAELLVLSRARLLLRRPRLPFPGAHLSRRAGTSLEFADHRPYQPGDDLRLVDWALYARHRKLMTKVFSREVEAPLYLLVDVSRSMELGGKFSFAVRLCAALCFLAFRGGDRFGVYPFRDQPGVWGKPRRGRIALARTFSELGRLIPQGKTNFSATFSRWAEKFREPGMCVVASDFLAPGFQEGLAILRHARHAVAAVQILAPEDLTPPVLGEIRLLDVEEGRGRPMVVGRAAQRAYQEALHRWNKSLAEACRELGVAQFLFAADSSPVQAALVLARRWRP
ncbi:MAG: DUF58 domain-containing protein [Candidatus Bipolaricaulota bacterium]|nr:DUF58 domain-containing protein [Candidatus Bipolaricaulota bacterium]MDW8127089.1 DUF58 domain-containing protein [Candidatus Bipolaricaulota bacterium]